MDTITLYLKYSMGILQDHLPNGYWSFYSQADSTNFEELCDVADFAIPAGFEVAKSTTGGLHFYSIDDPYPWLLQTDKKGNPYITDGLNLMYLNKV